MGMFYISENFKNLTQSTIILLIFTIYPLGLIGAIALKVDSEIQKTVYKQNEILINSVIGIYALLFITATIRTIWQMLMEIQ